MADTVHLLVDGLRYERWLEVELVRTIEAASGAFRLVLLEPADWRVTAGAFVQVLIGGEPVLAGNVDATARELTEGAGTRCTIVGRDLTADLVDCSAQVEGGELVDVTLEDLARALADPYGVEVKVASGTVRGDPWPRFAITPGELAWEALERALRVRGVLAYSDQFGALLLSGPGLERAQVDLVQGQVEAVSIQVDDSGRFRTYRARGQRRGNDQDWAAAVAESTGQALDLGAREGRLLELTVEQGATSADCQARASWEAAVRAARASTVDVVVRGFREGNGGRLWAVNRTTTVRVPSLGLDARLLVTGVRFLRDSGGDTCQLTLRRLDAFTPEPELPADDPIRSAEGLEEFDGL